MHLRILGRDHSFFKHKKMNQNRATSIQEEFFYLIFKCEIDITDEDNKMTKETMFKNLINKNKSLCAGF